MLVERTESSTRAAPAHSDSAPALAQMARTAGALAPGAQPGGYHRRQPLERRGRGPLPGLRRRPRPALWPALFRRQMLFDHQHPCYAGDLGLGVNPLRCSQRIRAADLLAARGRRLSASPGAGLHPARDIPTPQILLVHVHPDPDELGCVYQARSCPSTPRPRPFCAALPTQAAQARPARSASRPCRKPMPPTWPGATRRPIRIPGDLQMGGGCSTCARALADKTHLLQRRGQLRHLVHRFWPFRQFGTAASRPPAAAWLRTCLVGAGAQRLWPERTVVVFAGDGDFPCTARSSPPPCSTGCRSSWCCWTNGTYGTIRMHQEREYPHRVSGTSLQNPGLRRLRPAFWRPRRTRGTHRRLRSWSLTRLRTAGPGHAPARAAALPDRPEAITPTRSLSQIREVETQQTQIAIYSDS